MQWWTQLTLYPIGFAGNTLAKAAKVGLTTMAIDASLYASLAESTEEIRGRDIGLADLYKMRRLSLEQVVS